jgi:hypothetical protein
LTLQSGSEQLDFLGQVTGINFFLQPLSVIRKKHFHFQVKRAVRREWLLAVDQSIISLDFPLETGSKICSGK